MVKRRFPRSVFGAGASAAGSSRGHRHRVPAIAAALLALGVPAVVVVSTPIAAGSPAMVGIGAIPRIPAGARSAGALPSTATVSGTVVLKPRDNGALQRFIGAITDKSSPMFHRYLPAGAFASRFGPSQATVDAVRSQLRSDGLSVRSVSRSGMFVNFSGSAGQVESAFRTGLTKYTLADGTVGRATTSTPLVPSAIASSVAAVLGLNELVRERPAAVLRPPASDRGKIRPAAKAAFPHPTGSPTACAGATAAANAFGGLTDDQIAHAYGAFGLYGEGDLGTGQRIALYELEPFARSDIQTFDTCYFGAAAASKMLARLKVVPVDGGQPAGSGSGESNLDVENISALAPGAGIDVYTGPSPGANGLIYDPIDPYVAMVDDDRDQVISTSWGLCEQAIQAGQPGLQEAENLVFEQAAAQGQTVFDASGDNGSDDCNTFETSTPISGQNPLSIDDPSGQPYVVSVGGTTINDASGQRPQEQVWNDGALEGAAGGGISMSWTMPAWQRQATVPGISLPGSPDYTNADGVESAFGYPPDFCQSFVSGAGSTTPCRLVPDVTAQADQFTGAITVFQASFGGWTTAGGTSSSAPIWAALLAVVNASPTCAAQPSTSDGVGFASPLLYAVASRPAQYAASFNDVTAGNNDIYGLDNGLVFGTRPGYDLGSGLGSPRLSGPGGSAGLAFYLCSDASGAARPVVSGLTPKSGPTAGGEQLTITGSGFETGSSSDVAALQIGTLRIPASGLTVNSPTSITVTMPAARRTMPPDAPAPQDGAGPVGVIVILKDRQSSVPSPTSTFTYVDMGAGGPVPSIAGVVPNGGPESAPGPVTILGAGFGGATRVTFGGVAAPRFTVNNDHRITVTPPAFSSRQSCVPLPDTDVYAGENPTNDICQVQVRVANSGGASATSDILPPFEGAFKLDALGVLEPPPGCGCETQVAPTEFDYAPAPKITSISTSNGPSELASEKGTTVITVHGVGLGPLTIDWADVGDPGKAVSQDINYVFVTGRTLQIIAPRKPLTVEPASFPFSVKTVAGQSPPVTLQYAGIPSVTGVVNTTNSRQLKGISGAADTGGTPIKITGQGFLGQLIAPIEFSDPTSPFSLGTQYTFDVGSDTSISTSTVQQNPALVDVEVCTVTGCSHNPPADELYLYPPGDPSVTSVAPSTGPAAGGTAVTIHGHNLGCSLKAFFADAASPSVTPVPALLDCGSTTAVRAISPAGTAGSTVPVTVTTVDSFFTGSGRSTTSANFTYH